METNRNVIYEQENEIPDYGKISIIIPVYNVQKYLQKCIESVIAQTYKNIEIILVEDGSPDQCGKICDYFAGVDERIKVIHKENGGLCSARNAGLKAATGEYIGFVDSDDWCAPDMFEYLLSGLLKHDAQVASCRYYRVVKGKATTSRTDGVDVLYETNEALMEEFVKHFVIRSTFWNKLFRASLFEGKEFPEGRTYEGTYFMHEVLEDVERLVSLGQPKYYYVDNDSSIVRTRSFRNGMNYVYAYIKRYYDLAEKFPQLHDKLFDDAIKAILSLTYIGYKASEEEIAEKADDVQYMREFIFTHEDQVSKLSKTVKKEIYALIGGTKKEYKKAKMVRGIFNKASKVNELAFGKKLYRKDKIAVKKGKSNYIVVTDMSPEKQEILRKLQLTIVEIIDEIDRICKKYNLRYYIYGGTLLGAVRHKGFIPWDDDADLVMPRADYEKFLKICEKEFDGKYVLQNCFTDPEYHMLFTKIRKCGTYVHEEKWSGKDMNKGIFVDILPLDYFPKNKFMGSLVLHAVSICHQICAFKTCKSNRISAKILFKLGKKIPKPVRYKIRHWVLKISNRFSSKENICSFGSHYQPMIRRVFKTDWFLGEPKTMEFEGRQYSVPANWENYILHLFGENYMELPPEEMRVCHTDLMKINFDGDTKPEREWTYEKI